MRHQISSCLMALLMLTLAACDRPYTPPAPERQLATYPTTQAAPPPVVASAVTPAAPISGVDIFDNGTVIRVGLLLPLTGRNAELGKALQDAATLSLFDKYGMLSTRQASVRVELIPKDTGDTPEQAAQAMQEAIDEGVVFVIGPLFGEATAAAAPIARARNISVLSLSNDVSRGGNGVYMYGFSPQEQTARIVNYARTEGKARIAALVPDTPLGNMVLDASRRTLAGSGFVLAREVRYASQGVGIDKALEQLLPAGQAPDFDALLLPENGPVLGTILRALNTRGLGREQIQLISTGVWDDAALLRRVTLDGAWLASSPPANAIAFDQRFRSTYQYVPPRPASLAYDAVALAVTLGTSGRAFDAATLTSDAGFSGPANGVFRLRADGRTERGLAVLEVQSGVFRVLSPAPTGFQQ